jgi:hypothetical protein
MKPATKAYGVEFLHAEGGADVFKVQAGTYSFAGRQSKKPCSGAMNLARFSKPGQRKIGSLLRRVSDD